MNIYRLSAYWPSAKDGRDGVCLVIPSTYFSILYYLLSRAWWIMIFSVKFMLNLVTVFQKGCYHTWRCFFILYAIDPINSYVLSVKSITLSEFREQSYSHVSKIVISSPNLHYNDVIMGTMASQITSHTIRYSIVYWGADQSKHQSTINTLNECKYVDTFFCSM